MSSRRSASVSNNNGRFVYNPKQTPKSYNSTNASYYTCQYLPKGHNSNTIKQKFINTLQRHQGEHKDDTIINLSAVCSNLGIDVLPFTMAKNFFINSEIQLLHITEIKLSGKFNNLTDASYLFDGMLNLKTVDLTGCDCKNITIWHGTFSNCPKLDTIINIEAMFESAPTDIEHCFDNTGFKILDLSGWTNLKTVEHAHKFICNNEQLDTVIINDVNFENLKLLDNFVAGNPKLTTLNLQNTVFSAVEKVRYAFATNPLCENINYFGSNLVLLNEITDSEGKRTCFHKSTKMLFALNLKSKTVSQAEFNDELSKLREEFHQSMDAMKSYYEKQIEDMKESHKIEVEALTNKIQDLSSAHDNALKVQEILKRRISFLKEKVVNTQPTAPPSTEQLDQKITDLIQAQLDAKLDERLVELAKRSKRNSENIKSLHQMIQQRPKHSEVKEYMDTNLASLSSQLTEQVEKIISSKFTVKKVVKSPRRLTASPKTIDN